jgi:hypothetical protein
MLCDRAAGVTPDQRQFVTVRLPARTERAFVCSPTGTFNGLNRLEKLLKRLSVVGGLCHMLRKSIALTPSNIPLSDSWHTANELATAGCENMVWQYDACDGW